MMLHHVRVFVNKLTLYIETTERPHHAKHTHNELTQYVTTAINLHNITQRRRSGPTTPSTPSASQAGWIFSRILLSHLPPSWRVSMRPFPCRLRWGCFWAKSRCRSSRRCKFIRVHRSIHMNTCVSAYASLHVYGAGFVHLCPLVRVELLVVFLRRGGLRQCWWLLHHSSLWRVLRHRGTHIHIHPYLHI